MASAVGKYLKSNDSYNTAYLLIGRVAIGINLTVYVANYETVRVLTVILSVFVWNRL
jgi:hypothetical protein